MQRWKNYSLILFVPVYGKRFRNDEIRDMIRDGLLSLYVPVCPVLGVWKTRLRLFQKMSLCVAVALKQTFNIPEENNANFS
jgi:hypothetical protein